MPVPVLHVPSSNMHTSYLRSIILLCYTTCVILKMIHFVDHVSTRQQNAFKQNVMWHCIAAIILPQTPRRDRLQQHQTQSNCPPPLLYSQQLHCYHHYWWHDTGGRFHHNVVPHQGAPHHFSSGSPSDLAPEATHNAATI